MPLTPAEVHNVAFKKPPIGKRGYDEEEVDAFLDIVEVELSRLIEENNDLKARTNGAAPAAAPVDTGVSVAELQSAREDNARLQAHVGELERALNQGKDGAQQQVVQLQQQLAQTEQQLADNRRQLEQAKQIAVEARQAATQAQQAQQAAQAQAAQAAQAAQSAPAADASGPASGEHHAQAVQVLALAQQTADQHLAQSKAEAERLLVEAQNHAQSTVAEAQQRSTEHVTTAEARAKQLEQDSASRAGRVVQDAEQRAATITAQFEQRKAALERRVEELRTFEREYRTRLKSYLESQLRDLDASSKAEPAAPQGDMAEAQQG
jgi:DivIVA domain-containing protein